jgi:hypothetical protein
LPLRDRGSFDLIIMGTHGHGKLEERMIGSIAGDVIRQSSIPVLVVRLPGENDFGGSKNPADVLESDSQKIGQLESTG